MTYGFSLLVRNSGFIIKDKVLYFKTSSIENPASTKVQDFISGFLEIFLKNNICKFLSESLHFESIKIQKVFDSGETQVTETQIKKPLKGLYGSAPGPGKPGFSLSFDLQPELKTSSYTKLNFFGVTEVGQNFDRKEEGIDKMVGYEKLVINNQICKGVSIRYIAKKPPIESYCSGCYGEISMPQSNKTNTKGKKN